MELNIYYAERHRLDRIHAERFEGMAKLHRFPYGEHDLVQALRDSGWLRRLLLSFGGERGRPVYRHAFLAEMSAADRGIACDFEPDSNAIVVAFGGISGGVGAPVFEFFRILSRIGVKRVFVRDHHRAWYHRGVEGVGADIPSVASELAKLFEGHRAILIGNSAGGYAALLFGMLLGAEAHAFSPQTFICPELRQEHGDHRWPKELSAFVPDARYSDLTCARMPR